MPKERRNRSRSRASPFPCSSSSYRRHSSPSSSRNPPESSVAEAKEIKEWEDARCPVCMEHPHNAVLLLCSSNDKGCRPFMCDTSYRHSNCLDQYRKTLAGSSSVQESHAYEHTSDLSCPLCRGGVRGWTVVEPARKYMNTMARSCSLESCEYTGQYRELRKHARKEHPYVRPSEADPERQRDWRRMEQQRDIGDLFSTMRSAIGGEEDGLFSTMRSAIDGEEAGVGFSDEDEEIGGMLRMPPPLILLLVLHVSMPGGSSNRVRLPGSTSSRMRLTSSSLRGRTGRRPGTLWGETMSDPESTAPDEAEDDDNGDEDGASEEVPPPPSRQGQGRRRRQLRLSDDEDDEDGDGLV